MHSTETINQFINLRVQGWSFARIADQLHVSKPTLLDWNRKHQSELEDLKAKHERSIQESAEASRARQLELLTLFRTTLRQELIKRTLQNLSDDEIEALATDLEQQIEKLSGTPSALLAKEGGKEMR